MAYTTTTAAEKLGCDTSTVRRACINHSIGQVLGPRTRVLSAADLTRLKKIIQPAAGNPNFNAGNYFGGTRKRPRKKVKE